MSLRNVLMDDARDAQVAQAQRVRENETKETSTATGGTSAPADATYVLISSNAVLPNERVLAVTSPIALADAGPGGNVTISHALSGVGAGIYTKVTVNTTGHVTSGTTLSASDFQHTLLDGAAHADTVVQTPTRGSLVYGNATPKWDELVLAAGDGYALTSTATDVVWDQTPVWTGLHNFNAGLTILDDQPLNIGTDLDTIIVYDEAGDDRTEVTGADWFFDSLIVNIGTAAGGGGERLAVREDQDAVTAGEIVNANAGTAAAAFMRMKNTAGASGAAGAHELGVGVLGTGFTTAGIAFQDSAMIQAGGSLAGGMTFRTLGATPIVCGVNSNDEVWRADASGFAIPDDVYFNLGTDLDTRMRYDEAGDNRLEIEGADWLFDTVNVTLVSATSANPILTIENTNADAQAPTIDFYKNTASPANNDDLGAIDFFGETSTGAKERYAYILAESLDVTNGDTGGGLQFVVVMDAVERSLFEIAGYNGAVNEGEVVVNRDGQDVDFIVESAADADALVVQGDNSQVTLGGLATGLVLATAGVLSIAGAADLPAHDILSLQHGDTLAAAVSRGSLIYGNATPAWAELVHPGGAGYAFTVDATDVAWTLTPTWLGDHTWTSSVSAKPALVIENTNDDSVEPTFQVYKNSLTPADGDDTGRISFYANASGPAKSRMAYIRTQMLDRSSGDQAGCLEIGVLINNHDRSFAKFAGFVDGVVDTGRITFNDDSEDIDVLVKWSGGDALAVEGSSGDVLLAGFVGINETANANMTIGLTIDQAANDDEILNFRSSDVGAVLAGVETGTFCNMQKSQSTSGGLIINGYKDADGDNALAMRVHGHLAEDADVVKTTGARGITEISGFQTDGSVRENTVANGNVVAMRTQRGGAAVTILVIDEDADMNLPSGRIATGFGDYWDVEDYHAGAPTADGYVRVDINGVTYELLANVA